jgi:uncharacterized protein YecT (DUF1311 family)
LRALILVTLVALAGSAALAQEEEAEDCSDRDSTPEIVQCLGAQAAEWDRQLNTAYQKLLASVPARQRDSLRAAQRLWVQYRDANCQYYALGEGTIARIEAAECRRSMTESRAKELAGEQN